MKHIKEKLKGKRIRPVAQKLYIYKKCLITGRLTRETAKLENYVYSWGCLRAMLAAAV